MAETKAKGRRKGKQAAAAAPPPEKNETFVVKVVHSPYAKSVLSSKENFAGWLKAHENATDVLGIDVSERVLAVDAELAYLREVFCGEDGVLDIANIDVDITPVFGFKLNTVKALKAAVQVVPVLLNPLHAVSDVESSKESIQKEEKLIRRIVEWLKTASEIEKTALSTESALIVLRGELREKLDVEGEGGGQVASSSRPAIKPKSTTKAPVAKVRIAVSGYSYDDEPAATTKVR
jgi:hypothetical protein